MREKVKKVKKVMTKVKDNKESRTLLSNFGYLSLLQIAGYIFPLITLPYLAKIIGVESFGKIAFASAVIVWLQTISDWGFNFTATRDVAQNRDDKEKISRIFSNVLWAKLILMVLSAVLLVLAIAIVPQFNKNQEILYITFLIIPGNIFFPDWFFQAMERMKYITILNLVSKLLFTVLIFVFIKEKEDYILQPLFISLGYIISGIIAMYYILYLWKIKIFKPNLKEIIRTIKSSTDVFINNIMPNLYNSFSVMLLGFYGGAMSNGLLDAGNRFVNIAQQFMNTISRTFFPYLSRKLDKHDLYVKLNVYLSILFVVFLNIFTNFIFNTFFTIDFKEAKIALRILSISIFFITIRNTYGTHYLLIKGYEKELRNIIFIGSIIGFVLAFPLILYFNFIGAALNIVITQLIMLVMVYIFAKKIKNI